MVDYDTLDDYLHVFTHDGTLRETYGNLNGPYSGDKGGDFPRFSPDGQTIIYSADAPKGRGIFILRRGIAEKNLIVDWGREQIKASFFPDETMIAFASSVNPQGAFHSSFKPGDPFPFQIYVANTNGSNPIRVTSSDFEWANTPKVSPDGQRLVFLGNKTKGSGKGRGLFTIKPDGSSLIRLTSGNDQHPDWSPDGTKIVFERVGDGIYTIKPDGSGLTEIVNNTLTHDPSYRQPRAVSDYGQLLEEYAPQVRYEAQESFYADSAATIAQNPGNYLRREDGSIIAASSTSPYEPLSLSFLGFPNYANNAFALDSDFLDEEDGDYAADAQAMHADPAYADRVYGRAALGPDGRWWLQYWLFYYYNDQELLGVGLHEGDWEMVQYRLDLNGAPDLAAYSQHSGGEQCSWGEVERAWIEDVSIGRYAPVVYSARASHASYFHSGTYRAGTNPLPDDYATGDGVVTAPAFVPISEADPWTAWPGRWGASDGTGGGSASPDGPLYNEGGGKWNDPSAWADGLSECGSVGFTTSSDEFAPRVPAPEISVSRSGSNAVFDYEFPRWPAEPRVHPHFLVLTIDSVGENRAGIPYTPLSYTHRVSGRRGHVKQPIGLGPGPYRVLASAFAGDGRRSALVRGWLR